MSGLFPLLAALLAGLSLVGLFRARTLLRRILALNVLASALFLLLVTLARTEAGLDPVPHAMVLTGIVVAVSTTAAALALILRATEPPGDGKEP
ncbi:NADH-quinone oxidoreductase subunit K [Halomonas sp. 328]|uniref:NADH-quinone oxidoreductase subunit K n=1 Tax=Halomonas sp. 328 TaxID=2776704 RepID=UPI0018A70255|nr:NADH-quinone oxidoreductase subunit K [Halomonas sp. 328]MBF8224380.1 NADH-quinone oxidoreductase subunit K [Halomonas sp. 328]